MCQLSEDEAADDETVEKGSVTGLVVEAYSSTSSYSTTRFDGTGRLTR